MPPVTALGSAPTFADPVVIAMIGTQLALVIAAIVTGVIQILNARRVADVQRQQGVNTDKIGTIAEKTHAIEGHVNSERTELVGANKTLEAQNLLLREMLAGEKSRAQLLAQAAATRSRPAEGLPAPAAGPIAVIVENPEPVPVAVVDAKA